MALCCRWLMARRMGLRGDGRGDCFDMDARSGCDWSFKSPRGKDHLQEILAKNHQGTKI